MRSRSSVPPLAVASDPAEARPDPPTPGTVAARRRRLAHLLALGALRAARFAGTQAGPPDGPAEQPPDLPRHRVSA